MSAAKPRSTRWMDSTALAMVLGLAAFAAAGQARAAPDACVLVGTTATCSGDQSAGIVAGTDFPANFTVLNVNDLTGNIAPAADTNGIVFVGTSSVEINSELGANQIQLNGFAEGVIGSSATQVTINHTGDITGGFRGLNAHSTGGSVEINSQAAISDSAEAAVNGFAPSGDIAIDHTGDITAAGNRGISAFGSGFIDITQSGSIESVNQAIYANSSAGSVFINSTGSIETTSGDAIDAEATSAGRSAFVVRSGDTSANARGIFVFADQTASIDSTGDVTSANHDALHAISANSSAIIVSRGDVQAENQGIFAQGLNAATITSTGDVTANTNDAVFALITGGGDARVTSVGDIDAGNRGIIAMSNNFAAVGSVAIESQGDVSAKGDAILAFTHGGLVYVNQIGDVSSTEANGIRGYNNGNSGGVLINSEGDIDVDDVGIDAAVLGTGSITITHSGDIDATSDSGVRTYVQTSGSTSIGVTGDIAVENHGIQATNNGTGGIDINFTGDLSATNGQGIAAIANGFSADGNVTINSQGDIESGGPALYARSNATDAVVTITSVGDVESANANGITGEAMSSGGTVTIESTGDIDAGDTNRAISAIAHGSVSVTSEGDLAATNGIWAGQGIYAQSLNAEVFVSSSGDIDAGNSGITVIARDGSSIDQMGDVTATGGDGLFIFANGGTGDSSITSIGDVAAGSSGITIRTTTGGASIDSEGDVSADGNALEIFSSAGGASIFSEGDLTSRTAIGIRAYGANGDVFVVSEGDIVATSKGIDALIQGDGDIEISQNGSIGGDGANLTDTGVVTHISGNGDTSIEVDGDIAANKAGIWAFAQGTGSISIEHAGGIVATNDRGISAQSSGNISITNEGFINSGAQGIFANSNNASGATITIDNEGAITAANHNGIQAEALGSGSTVTVVQKGDITYGSTNRGVAALAHGDVSVSVEGNVTNGGLASGDGIVAQSFGGTASIMARGDVTAGNQGIFALGQTGASIFSRGNVTNNLAGGNDGIFSMAFNGDASVDSVGDVNAGVRGVLAITNNGDASVTSTGTVNARLFGVYAQGSNGDATLVQVGNVTSTQDTAVAAYTFGGDASVDVTGIVTGQRSGVVAGVTGGIGNATVRANGHVTGTDQQGIVAFASDGNAQIEAMGGVTSLFAAITGVSSSGGGVIINSVGDLVSTNLGNNGIGVNAFAGNGSVVVSTTGNILALERGINAVANGNGVSALVESNGNVTQSRFGVFAQANGTNSHATVISNGTVLATKQGLFALGGSSATVNFTGDVTSTEDDAIFAMAIGGTVIVNSNGSLSGDVNGFDNRSAIFALSQGNGDVNVTHVGQATTGGTRRAIHAQAEDGNVSIDVTGDVFVTGNTGESDAIFALAPSGQASVMIRSGSTITGGSDALASFGVEFGGGNGPNTLTNHGIIDDSNGGKTIGGGTGAELVTNFGEVDGDFYLGDGANQFDNMAGGRTWFRTYSQVGAGNSFNNFGLVSPNGVGNIGKSVLDGNMMQSGPGTFVVDLDLGAPDADYLKVTGDLAAGGFVIGRLSALPNTLAPFTTTVIETDGAVTDNGITGISGPLAINVTTTATTVDINASINFGAQGALAGNQGQMGTLLQDLFTAGLGAFTPDQQAFYLALLNLGSFSGYQGALDQLSGESANSGVLATLGSAQGFSDRLFSCRQRDGEYRYIAEGSCYWGSASGGIAEHEAAAGGLDYTDRATWLSGGAQARADNGWVFGFGLGYENGTTDVDPSVDLDRELFSGGLVAKLENGPWLFGAALSGAFGTIESRRNLTVPVAATASADRSIAYGDVTARVAYLIDLQSHYIKPIAEASLTHVRAGGYTETGAGIANLTVGDQSIWAGRGSLAVEFGFEQVTGDGAMIRPRLLAGVSLNSQDVDATVGLNGLGLATTTLTTETDPVSFDLQVGMDVLSANGWVASLAYDGSFSDSDRRQAVSFKLAIPF